MSNPGERGDYSSTQALQSPLPQMSSLQDRPPKSDTHFPRPSPLEQAPPLQHRLPTTNRSPRLTPLVQSPGLSRPSPGQCAPLSRQPEGPVPGGLGEGSHNVWHSQAPQELTPQGSSSEGAGLQLVAGSWALGQGRGAGRAGWSDPVTGSPGEEEGGLCELGLQSGDGAALLRPGKGCLPRWLSWRPRGTWVAEWRPG